MGKKYDLGQRTDVRLVSADPAGFLSHVTALGLKLSRIRYLDELTVTATLPTSQLPLLKTVADKIGVTVHICGTRGLVVWINRQLHRPVLIFGIFILLFLTWFIPGRVLFVRIEGNMEIPAASILEAAEESGIYFGASRRMIRSEQVKNHLLNRLPQLEWVGVNTQGCVAVISVSPKTESNTPNAERISSIVAQRDGVITNCTVTAGTALCVPGQAVKKGDVLVSAYTDTGLQIRAQHAKGEIFAATKRQLTVIEPLDYTQKGEISHTTKNFSLLLGKKRINFFKDSGISPSGCDKMYAEYYMVLPGGYQLPLALAVEDTVYYEAAQAQTASSSAKEIAKAFANDYLLSQMISGKMLHTRYTEEVTAKAYILHTEAACLEMIGRQRIEENLADYGKNG